MFDDYSATLPLIIVVVFETFSVAWLYGADRWGLFLLFRLWGMFLDSCRSWVPCKYQLLSHENKPLPVSYRFLDDIEVMLGWRPSVIYKYLWKYICLLAMLGLLGATTIRMFIKYPTYMAWNQEKVWRNRLCTLFNAKTVHLFSLWLRGWCVFLWMEFVYNKVRGKNSQNVFSQNMSDMLLHEWRQTLLVIVTAFPKPAFAFDWKYCIRVLTDHLHSHAVQATEEHLEYPGWALAVLALLIIFAMMPVPVGLIHALLQDRTKRASRDSEIGQYRIVNTDDKCDTPVTDMTELDRRDGAADSFP